MIEEIEKQNEDIDEQRQEEQVKEESVKEAEEDKEMEQKELIKEKGNSRNLLRYTWKE